jgi:hypothetical protein
MRDTLIPTFNRNPGQCRKPRRVSTGRHNLLLFHRFGGNCRQKMLNRTEFGEGTWSRDEFSGWRPR